VGIAHTLKLLEGNPDPTLRELAEGDLVLVYAQGWKPGGAWSFLERATGERRARTLMLELAKAYEKLGKTSHAAEIRADLARR